MEESCTLQELFIELDRHHPALELLSEPLREQVDAISCGLLGLPLLQDHTLTQQEVSWGKMVKKQPWEPGQVRHLMMCMSQLHRQKVHVSPVFLQHRGRSYTDRHSAYQPDAFAA